MNTYRFLSLLAGALALSAASGYAQIVYSGAQNISFTRSEHVVTNPMIVNNPAALTLDFNSDGTGDFSVFTAQPTPSPTFRFFGARGLGNTTYLGLSSSVMDVVLPGVMIGAGPQWISGVTGGLPLPAGQNWWSSSFYGAVNSHNTPLVAYLGFRLSGTNGAQYGWIGYELPTGTNTSLVIRDWAYESRTGVAIAAGDRGFVAVPEPSTYGLIGAAGLVGLVVLRRRRVAK